MFVKKASPTGQTGKNRTSFEHKRFIRHCPIFLFFGLNCFSDDFT